MKNDLASMFSSLRNRLSEELSTAHDLWTWLPSYKVAQKNHGDYASEYCPCVKDVMVEAAMFIAVLKAEPLRDYTLDEKDWFNRCPCGEEHVDE